MVYNRLRWEVTVDIVLVLLAISLGQLLGGFAASAFGILGIVIYALLALVSLVGGVYLIVRGLAKLVEEIVRVEVARRA